jgi:multiple sugar transport system substrate-binding protein
MVQILQKFKGKRLAWGRVLGCIGIGVALLLSMSGCGSVSDGKTQLQLSTWGSAQEIADLKALVAEFERKNPKIRVNLLHIPDNYYQKLHILIAGDMSPDVMLTNSVSFPVYASQGIFLDLKPLLEQSKILKQSDFYEQALQSFQWQSGKGAILGALPRDISNVVVFYNRELFKKAGLPEPQAGWDWDAFLKTAQKLTIDADHDGYPEVFGLSFYAKPPLFWLPFVWSAGGDLFSLDLKRIVLDSPQALDGLQFYADLRNRWHVAPLKVESGGATMSQLFMQQKLAMMVSGRWSVPVLREQAKFQWDVVPLPVGPAGRSRVGIDASGYAISAKSRHPRESFALVEFLLSRASIQKIAASGLIVPARKDVAESAEFLQPHQPPRHGKVFLDVIPDGVPTHTPSRWNELSEELQLALEPVWDGQTDARTAVRKVKAKLEKILEVSP